MTRLLWVRHGPTHAKGMVGHTDLAADLSDSAAIARLAAHLPDAPVVSSDLIRAVATADAIQGARPRLPHLPALREIHFGAWEMLRHDEIEDQAAARAWWDDPGDTAPPGGESWNAVSARVNDAVDRLIGLGHPAIIAVAHFGVILTQIQRAEGTEASAAFGHRIDPLSVTEIVADPAGWRTGAINHRP